MCGCYEELLCLGDFWKLLCAPRNKDAGTVQVQPLVRIVPLAQYYEVRIKAFLKTPHIIINSNMVHRVLGVCARPLFLGLIEPKNDSKSQYYIYSSVDTYDLSLSSLHA